MKSLQTFLSMSVILGAFYQTDAKRDITIELMDVRFNIADSKFVKYINYKVFGRKVIYSEVELLKNISDFDVKFNFDLVKKDKSHINLINQITNGCESLEKAQKIKLLNAVFQEIVRASNLPNKCPLLANKRYVFQNYTLRDEDYPATLPIIDWELRAYLLVNKKIRCNGTFVGRVRQL